LWQEFEAAFKGAWTDMSKKQNAYNQLIKLTMTGWDIDTYITTFECLALAAGWEQDCHGFVRKSLDSAVMTTQAESRISHGLLVVIFLSY
jgi:hypothetical protein